MLPVLPLRRWMRSQGCQVSFHSSSNRFCGQRVQAHLPYTGTYQGQGAITHSYVCPHRRNLIFELDGLEFLQPGTPISFLDRLQIEDGYLSAQLDNVLSVAMLIHLFRHGFEGTALFTAQEEAGRSWRHALAWFQRQQIWTDRLIVLDTSPYPSREAADAQDVVLRRKDANGAFSAALTDSLVSQCEQFGIRYSSKMPTLNHSMQIAANHCRLVARSLAGWCPRRRAESTVRRYRFQPPAITPPTRRHRSIQLPQCFDY